MTTGRAPGWTKAQRIVFVAAATKAGWNDQQRYAVMRYAGCPNDRIKKRPSLTNPDNRGLHHRACMAIAEAACKAEGISIRPPRHHPTWHELANSYISREREFARAIAAEAATRLPKVFDRGLLNAAVAHVADETSHPFLAGVKPETIEQCDGPTTHRVVECLRAWVGRKFEERGIRPHCFTIPRRAVMRAQRADQRARKTA